MRGCKTRGRQAIIYPIETKQRPSEKRENLVCPVAPIVIAYSILCIAGLSAATGRAQTGPPPVKMGLWEATVTQTMTGLQLPPGVAEKLKEMGRPAPDAPKTSVYQTCMTPEQWNKNMSEMQTQNKNCTRTNVVENSHKTSFDMTCQSSRPGENSPGSTGRMEMVYESPEKTHGTMTMKHVETGAQAGPVDVVIRMQTRFLSSNCGDLKPGESKPLDKK